MIIQPKKLLIVTQILLVSTLQNEQITIWRISILMLGRKGLSLLWWNYSSELHTKYNFFVKLSPPSTLNFILQKM